MLKIADRVHETSTVTDTSTITLAGVFDPTFMTFASAFTVGDVDLLVCVKDLLGNWETGLYTFTSTSLLTKQATRASSNGGLSVTFPAGVKSVFSDVDATAFRTMMTRGTIPFNTSVPLDSGGVRFMNPYSITGATAFTIAANPVQGSIVYLRLTADGLHVPTFPGYSQWGGSLTYNNTAGICNQIQFMFDGVEYMYAICSVIGATAGDTIPPTAVSASVSNASPTVVTITMSEALDPAYVATAGDFTVSGKTTTGTPVVSGATVAVSVTSAFTNGQTATAGYTKPSSNGIRDIAGNQMATFSVLTITNGVGVAATGITMSGPTVGGSGVASTNFNVGVTPFGSNITGTIRVTFNDSSDGGTFTPAYVDLTNASPTGNATYTPASTGTKTIAETNNGSISDASSISYVSATVPAAPTIGTNTSGTGNVSVTFTANGNGGSAIIDYKVTLSTGQTATGTTSPIVVTCPAGTAVTATVQARNLIGYSSPSGTSGSATPSAPVITYDPTKHSSSTVLSGGNLVATVSGSTYQSAGATPSKSTGHWYWEAVITAVGGKTIIGIANPNFDYSIASTLGSVYVASNVESMGYGSDGNVYASHGTGGYEATYTTGDVIGIELDCDAHSITFYKNNAMQTYTVFPTIPTTPWTPASTGYLGSVVTMNFSSGSFVYTPPSGASALT